MATRKNISVTDERLEQKAVEFAKQNGQSFSQYIWQLVAKDLRHVK